MGKGEQGLYLALLHIPFYVSIVSAHALVRQQVWGFSGFLIFFLCSSYLLWVFGYRKLYYYWILFTAGFLLCGFFALFHADWVIYLIWLFLMYGGIKFSPVVFSHQHIRQNHHHELFKSHFKLLNPEAQAPLYDELNAMQTLNASEKFYAGALAWENPQWSDALDKNLAVPKGLICLVYLTAQRAMKNLNPLKISLSYAEGKKAKSTGNIRIDWEFDTQDAVFDGKWGVYDGASRISKYIEDKHIPCVLIKGFRKGKYVIRLGFFTQ